MIQLLGLVSTMFETRMRPEVRPQGAGIMAGLGTRDRAGSWRSIYGNLEAVIDRADRGRLR